MKNIFIQSAVILLGLILQFHVGAQQIPDTVIVRRGSLASLQIDWKADNYGSIQWQRSDDGENWTDVRNAINPVYEFHVFNDLLVRAQIISQDLCEPLYVVKAIKMVDFSVTLEKINAHSIVFELTNVDFKNADVVEYGFSFNRSDINTRSIHQLYKQKLNTPFPAESSFQMICDGLEPATAYNIRTYFKLADGTMIYGPSSTRTTVAGVKWSSEDWTINKNSMLIRFELAGYGSSTDPEIVVKFGTSPDDLQNISFSNSGNYKYTSQLNRGLNPNTTYFTQVEVRINNEWQVITKEVKTLSDYSNVVVDNTSSGINHTIVWDTTRHRISPVGQRAEYPRIIRVNNDTLLCSYHGGKNDWWVNIYLQKSFDNGKTWTEPIIVLDKENAVIGQNYWRFTNPEMTKLKNGWIIMSITANGRPETNDNCHVMVMISKDNGDTWGDPIIVGRGRTWEPMIVQLPNGELELYVSSEAQWWGAGVSPMPQEILFSRSTDNGLTWTQWKRASYSPNRRDGMPIGIVMQGNKGVLFSIEIVNDNGWGSPSFVRRGLNEEWDANPWNNADTDKRWHIPMNAHGGAPHTVQLPTGEIVVMAHSNGRSVWQTGYPRVVIADSNGKIFTAPDIPIKDLPRLEGMYYNSLFLKDDSTIWLVVTNALYASDGTTRLKGEIKYIEGKITSIK